MFFLLKRTVAGSLPALLLLSLLGAIVRHFQTDPVPLGLTWSGVGMGALVCGVMLCSDGLIHGSLWLLLGERYLSRYRQLAGLFRQQSYPALVCGALMAGIGEEL